MTTKARRWSEKAQSWLYWSDELGWVTIPDAIEDDDDPGAGLGRTLHDDRNR